MIEHRSLRYAIIASLLIVSIAIAYYIAVALPAAQLQDQQERRDKLVACLNAEYKGYYVDWDAQCVADSKEKGCLLSGPEVTLQEERFGTAKADCFQAFPQ